jgi:hypothetical protein
MCVVGGCGVVVGGDTCEVAGWVRWRTTSSALLILAAQWRTKYRCAIAIIATR